MKKLAIVTQSYKADFDECGLLCKSIDKFVPGDILHYIFVNDEDYTQFLVYDYGQHCVLKKSTILPRWLIRIPFKIKGHYFHISPFTYPVRGWIIQQICKLGVFEVIDESIDAVLNIDSETVFVRPFDYNQIVQNDRFLMYKDKVIDQPCIDQYCKAAISLLDIQVDISKLMQFDYMNVPVCFERNNTKELLETISRNTLTQNWKIALCNRYRFSEYFLYGIYVDYKRSSKSHFVINKYLFPQIDISEYNTKNKFQDKVCQLNKDSDILGFWLQKKNRKDLNSVYLDFNSICDVLNL